MAAASNSPKSLLSSVYGEYEEDFDEFDPDDDSRYKSAPQSLITATPNGKDSAFSSVEVVKMSTLSEIQKPASDSKSARNDARTDEIKLDFWDLLGSTAAGGKKPTVSVRKLTGVILSV